MLSQQDLVQPAGQAFFAVQQAFLHPTGQLEADVLAQELKANAETARTDITDRLLITFFIGMYLLLGVVWRDDVKTSSISLRETQYFFIPQIIEKNTKKTVQCI